MKNKLIGFLGVLVVYIAITGISALAHSASTGAVFAGIVGVFHVVVIGILLRLMEHGKKDVAYGGFVAFAAYQIVPFVIFLFSRG